MIERLTTPDLSSQSRSLETITEISNLSRQISEIYSLRDFFPSRYLPQEEWNEVKRLHELKDQKTIDLLLQNKDNSDGTVQLVLQKFPKEKIHPFSMNNIFIFVPSIQNPNKKYMIKTELSDLRRPGVVENSQEARTLLGDIPEANETGLNFIHRTNEELVKIKQHIQSIKHAGKKGRYSIDELEDLSAKLITERLMPLRSSSHFPSNSSLSFYMYEDRTGKVLSEAARLKLEGRLFEFEISGQRLQPLVSELGGYDKIITLIS